jgi:DNA-binding CsgD family transcriptional regulator
MATLPSGTVTFLLTDIAGSTALWERQPETMRAAVAVAVGQPERAAKLLGGAAALRERAGAEPPGTYRDVDDRAAAAMRTALGEEAFLAAWIEGRRMTAEEAMTFALAAAAAMQAGTHADEEERSARAYPDDLTEREVEVLRLLAGGLSNREIADNLVISIRTVERHIANIYEKIGAHGVTARVTATTYAVSHGLAEVPTT